jgi:hypothetical protein
LHHKATRKIENIDGGHLGQEGANVQFNLSLKEWYIQLFQAMDDAKLASKRPRDRAAFRS